MVSERALKKLQEKFKAQYEAATPDARAGVLNSLLASEHVELTKKERLRVLATVSHVSRNERKGPVETTQTPPPHTTIPATPAITLPASPSIASTAPEARAITLTPNFAATLESEVLESVREEFNPRFAQIEERFDSVNEQFNTVNTTLQKIDSTLEKALTGQVQNGHAPAQAELVVENASGIAGEQKITLPHVFWIYYEWATDHGARVPPADFITECVQDYFKKVKGVSIGMFTTRN